MKTVLSRCWVDHVFLYFSKKLLTRNPGFAVPCPDIGFTPFFRHLSPNFKLGIRDSTYLVLTLDSSRFSEICPQISNLESGIRCTLSRRWIHPVFQRFVRKSLTRNPGFAVARPDFGFIPFFRDLSANP